MFCLRGLEMCGCDVLLIMMSANRLLKIVMSAARTRQKLALKRSLLGVNEHFEPMFNTVIASGIVKQQPAKVKSWLHKQKVICNTTA
jgi:hypothetical protein